MKVGTGHSHSASSPRPAVAEAEGARLPRRAWLGRLPWSRSLRAKLIGLSIVTTLVALAVALVAMVAHDIARYERTWLADMQTQAELLGQTIAPALAFNDPKVARENLALLRLRPAIRAAAVYDAQSRLVATYVPSGTKAPFPRTLGDEGALVSGEDVVVVKRLLDAGELLGFVYLRAHYGLDEQLHEYRDIAVIAGTLALIVAVALALVLQRVITRPILEISTVAGEVVAQEDYSRRVQRYSEDEVGKLVDSFNRMMAVIQQRTDKMERALRESAREVIERREAQGEVMRLNAELEQRVRERTSALEASNQELALATEAAERANRAKSEFISSMSHELRTPLNAILGFGHLLITSRQFPPQGKQLEFLQHIVKAGHHLLTLINEILDLARIESANLMLSLEPVQLDETLAECRTMIEPAAERRGIHMLFPDPSALCVVADRTRLKQVLLNLLSNAVKYNREGGSVVIDGRTASDSLVRITVQDTGIGLSTEQVAALFQPFNRLGQESSATEGTGIGLVVTKRLVDLMGGSIGVSSVLGVGTSFWVEFPVGTSEDAAVRRPVAQHEEGPRPATENTSDLILYVEDNPANLVLAEEIIAARGDLRFMSAPDARLGIELARAHAPRVILMDLNLPGLSGQDALKILRAVEQTQATPVIAVTANAMPRDRSLGLAAGFFRYVTKPIDVERLNEAIDDALSVSAKGGGPSKLE